MLWFFFSKCANAETERILAAKNFLYILFFYSSQYTPVKMKQTDNKFQNDKKESMKMKKTAYAWYPKFLDWTWIKISYIACHEYASKMRKLWERSLIIIIIIIFLLQIRLRTSPSTCTYTMRPLDDGSLTPINKRFSMVFWNVEILSFDCRDQALKAQSRNCQSGWNYNYYWRLLTCSFYNRKMSFLYMDMFQR